MAPVIQLRNVYKSFGQQEVLRGLNLKVERGETKIILGGSGQGKSTILRLILGLEKPDEGEILIEGVDICPLSEEKLVPIRKQMGMVFQEGSLFDSLNVFENISYRMREEGKLSEDEILTETLRLLKLVDLSEADLEKLPSQLSGGMKRRVNIARAMAGERHIMLYDEPTAGLDPITSRHITELIIRLRDLEQMTSILVTQDLISSYQIVTECAHRVPSGIRVSIHPDHSCTKNTKLVILRNGVILIEGGIRDLLSSPDPYVQEFLSSLKIFASQ
jgi:phospholipid/cholesterol/gamma-HCH transport system ATP-binding protein